MRAPGIPFKGGDNRGVGSQAEFHGRHPPEGAAVEELGIDQAEQEAAIVAPLQEGIVHLQRSIAGGKIERNDLIIPKEFAVAQFEVIDREVKKLFDRRLGALGGSLTGWEICGAVRVKHDMNDRLLEDDLVEGKLEIGRAS